MRDSEAARTAVADVGKVGIVGFCMDGTVAFLAATRLAGISAASCFYGGKIDAFADEAPQCATQMHYGSEDHGIPMENVESVRGKRPDCEIFFYQGAGHGFHCDARASFDPEASKVVWDRTLELFESELQ